MLSKALSWIKKWGPWIVFPIGIFLFLSGRRSRQVSVSSPELVGHQKVRERLDGEVEKKVRVIEKKRSDRLREIDERHDHLDQVKARQAEALRKDPEALTKYLKEVGHGVGRQSKNERR